MTDNDLIARLREDVFYGDERLHNLSRHNPLHMEAADRIEALVKENIALKEHVADMLAEQECGCGYDKPTDVCLGHLPLHRKTVARAERLEAALQAVLHTAHTDDYVGWQTALEDARAALKGDDHE